VRNIFDQYSQPENKLTHALSTTLTHDRELIRPFLRWLGVHPVPPLRGLHVSQQQVPGELNDAEPLENSGVPDMCVFNEEGWLCLFEAKVQAQVKADQLRRHIKTAERHDYADPWVVVLAVDPPKGKLPAGVIYVEWRDLYVWFRQHARSFWARQLIDYMQVFESKMVWESYDIRGTITMFDGIQFDDENPFTFRESKRLIRLLGEQLQARKDLHKIGVDPKGTRRDSFKGKGDGDRVWDFLPLVVAKNAKSFTDYPHLSMGISSRFTTAAITIPNAVRGGFRTRLKRDGLEEFVKQLQNVYDRMRPVLKQSIYAKPIAYVMQRHYLGQSSASEILDARLETDLRTCISGSGGGVKYQPEWIEAIYELLINKKSNIQFVASVQFSYECPQIRSAKAVDLFAKSWIAMSPILELALKK
jgi:hypothetical protein